MVPIELPLLLQRTTCGNVVVTSPAIPQWSTVVSRGPDLPAAIEQAWREASIVAYAAERAEPYDRVVHDMAAAKAARYGKELQPEDVVIVRPDPLRNDAGRRMRPGATNGARHDPFAWTDLGNGFWQSPAGHRYPESSTQVQRVIAARQRTAPATTSAAAGAE